MTAHQAHPSVKLEVWSCSLGPYETNCYVAWPKGEKGCWIIDASFDPEPIIDFVRAEGLRPEMLVLTHAHVDHIAGAAQVVRAFQKLPVAIHTAETEWLSNPMLNLSAMGGIEVTAPGPDRLLHDGDELTLGPLKARILHAPGHSPGGVAIFIESAGLVFGGDALFAGSIGRADLPGGNMRTLANSIRTKLYTLPDSTRVLSGHGPPTTIGREKATNPFVRAD